MQKSKLATRLLFLMAALPVLLLLLPLKFQKLQSLLLLRQLDSRNLTLRWQARWMRKEPCQLRMSSQSPQSQKIPSP